MLTEEDAMKKNELLVVVACDTSPVGWIKLMSSILQQFVEWNAVGWLLGVSSIGISLVIFRFSSHANGVFGFLCIYVLCSARFPLQEIRLPVLICLQFS